jgi:hypothetical protein
MQASPKIFQAMITGAKKSPGLKKAGDFNIVK